MEKKTILTPETGGTDPLSYAVIGAAMKVHSELGPGLDESFYHQLLSVRLDAAGVAHQSKARGELFHRGKCADRFECDFLFKAGLIAELKTLSGPDTFAPDHFTQLICYLKFWRIGTGLLLDFGKESLIYRRVVFTEKPVSTVEVISSAASDIANLPCGQVMSVVRDSLTRVYETHGLGYRDTTYRGLIAADLTAENVNYLWQPIAAIIDGTGVQVGNAPCDCFVVENSVALMVLALRNRITTTDRAILQNYLRHLGLEIGVIANFGKQQLELLPVSSSKAVKSNQK